MRMPPYDAAAICPKCGHDDISTQYRSSGNSWLCGTECFCDYAHIHRYCRRCGADWLEAPLDAKTEEKQ